MFCPCERGWRETCTDLAKQNSLKIYEALQVPIKKESRIALAVHVDEIHQEQHIVKNTKNTRTRKWNEAQTTWCYRHRIILFILLFVFLLTHADQWSVTPCPVHLTGQWKLSGYAKYISRGVSTQPRRIAIHTALTGLASELSWAVGNVHTGKLCRRPTVNIWRKKEKKKIQYMPLCLLNSRL